MKKYILGFLCLSLLIASACHTTKTVSNGSSDSALLKITEVVNIYDLLTQSFELDYETASTWIDAGFRSKYSMTKKHASLKMIESAFGVPVFLSGPHKEDMDFNSQTSFGHYNPEFIAKLDANIKAAMQNPALKKAMKSLYQQHFRSMALTYQNAYQYLNHDPVQLGRFKATYHALITQTGGTSEGSLQEEFRSYADNGFFASEEEKRTYEKENQTRDWLKWYEQVSAPAFWLRRSMDGTSDQLYGLLDMVITEMED